METTLLKQFQTIKNKYPDAVLLMRKDDEFFTIGHDAETLLKICGIDKEFAATLLDYVLQKLVRAGYRVAIAEER